MTRGVLAGHDRDPRGGAHAHGIKLIEPDTLLRQSLHPRRAVIVVQRIPLGLAILIGEERHGRVHYAHVINQKHHDVGQLGRGQVGEAEEEEGKDRKEYFHDFG